MKNADVVGMLKSLATLPAHCRHTAVILIVCKRAKFGRMCCLCRCVPSVGNISACMRSAHFGQDVGKRRSANELHCEEVTALFHPHAVDRHNMRMIQRGDSANLVLKALQ
ncbi:MAG: hypothetical protein U0805_07685 [Pirellulales bacterium]